MLTQKQSSIIEKLFRVDDISGQLSQLLSDTQRKLNELAQFEAQVTEIFDAREIEIRRKIGLGEARLREDKSALDRLASEKAQGFPWLADAISQYTEFMDSKVAEQLETKSHPAIASAEKVRKIAAEKREFQRKFIITRNFIRYYEALFPWLREFAGDNVDDLLIQVTQTVADDQDADPARTYLTDGEYESLSTIERNQRALDRYWASRKSSWQVGRDYERYIGFLYEQKGFSVYYQGIEQGFEDLGRDLICKKDNRVEIVQCKYWRQDRTIHEKHINQLFGTTVEYFIRNISRFGHTQLDLFPSLLKQKGIAATFITSAQLSDTARDFATALGVTVLEGFAFKRYPSIKCNVSRKDGTKIYHLPFDQQYDRTTIEEERNEHYVETVQEAERLGFRRAWRWRGNRQ